MKRLMQVLMAIVLVHALGAGVFVAWFYMARMNEQYADALGRMLKGEPLELAGDQTPADQQPTTKPAAMTAADVQRLEQIALLEADIAYSQLLSLQRSVEARSADVKRKMDELVAKQKKWADQQAARSQQRENDGFQRALTLYESMKAREVKEIWIGLSEDILVALVRNMEPGKVAKIFKEFREADEIEAKRRVLERIREGSSGDVTGAAKLATAGS